MAAYFSSNQKKLPFVQLAVVKSILFLRYSVIENPDFLLLFGNALQKRGYYGRGKHIKDKNSEVSRRFTQKSGQSS